ncbi:MAG: hypothetical protein DBX59_02175 [Bacillota bacterium]|nr:MAG: hypothetical protein DBX59_02175 [Bacillota bacterium]
MTAGEILSLVGLAISAAAFVTGSIVFFKNMGKDAADRGGRNAKLESKLDFIKIQTELINAKSNAIAEKLDDQNGRLIVAEQKIAAANLPALTEKVARMDESLSNTRKQLDEILRREEM